MNRDDCTTLIERMIQRVNSDTTDQAPEMMVETAAAFLDPERLTLERQRLFLDTPQVIGFAGEVAQPNAYITAEVMNIPIVVTRAQDGQLRAFVNACAHRGARVAKDCGVKKRLTCGFHGWSYALDGTLAGRPKDDAFDTPGAETHLQALPVSDRSGLIVVGLQPEMKQATVDHYLDDIAPAFAGYGFDNMHSIETRRYEVNADWKLVVGLSHESYHFSVLHRESLSSLMTSHAVIDTFGQHSRWAFSLRGITDLEDKPQDQWPDRFPGAINHTVFPGTVIIVNPADAQIIRTEPGITPGTSVVYFSGVCADINKLEESRQGYEFGGSIFETEDLPAAEQCQQGLAGGQTSVIFGRNEPIVQFWHRQWNKALTD